MASSFKMNLKVDVSAAQKAVAVVGKGIDRKKLLSAIGLRWLKWVNDNLQVGGLEKPWAQMAQNTVGVNPQRPTNRHPSSRYVTHLKQSFVSVVDGNLVTVGTDDPFSIFMDQGTKPHKILPRNAKMLRFQVFNPTGNKKGSKKGGAIETVFSGGVNHPGTPPRPLLPTKAVADNLAMSVLNAYVDKIMVQANGPKGPGGNS